jgi:hypothetical protein
MVENWIAKLKHDLDAGERAAIYGVLRDAVPNFAGVMESAKQLLKARAGFHWKNCRLDAAAPDKRPGEQRQGG